MDEGKTLLRDEHHLMGAGAAVPVAVLARRVEGDAVMGMLEGGDGAPRGAEEGNEALDQRRLAAARSPAKTKDAQGYPRLSLPGRACREKRRDPQAVSSRPGGARPADTPSR